MIRVFQEYRRSLLTFLIFIAYAAAVFWGNYQSLQKLRENASIQQRLESEKRASVIAYYFSSRQDDVGDLAESEVIAGFFNNRDMGMSFQYGLGVNVELIEARFERVAAMKRVGDYPVYSGFMLFDGDGVMVASWNRPGTENPAKTRLDSGSNEIRTLRGDKKGELLIKAPVRINQVYRGELLAWVNVQASLAQFGAHTDGNYFLVDRASGKVLSSGSEEPDLSASYSRALRAATGSGGSVAKLVLEDSGQEAMAVTRIDIAGTPLSYVEISPMSVGMTGFSRFFLVAAGVIPLIVLLLVFLDVRERRRLELLREQARIEAERLAQARSDFLANMSHEIRTPMNAIVGMTGLCLETQLEPKQRSYLSKIQRASDALLRIVNDVLDFSKIESGKLEIESLPFDMDRVLEGVSALFSDKAADKGIELIFDVDATVTPTFIGDSLRLEQILTNLVGNAIKFADRGNVVVRMRSKSVDAGTARLLCEVSDEGIGLSPDQQARLFSPFTQADATTTRRFGGSGLGLVICKRLVEMMGGAIGVDSRPNEGSTFWFDVRLGVDSSRVSAIQEMRQQLSPYAQRPVLVVDGNAACRAALEAQLGQLGLSSESCASGEEAISALGRDEASDYLYVMVDFRLVHAVGVEVERLRQCPKAERPLPIMLMATPSHDQEVENGNGVFDGVLIKPASATRIFAELAPLLGLKPRAAKVAEKHPVAGLERLRGMEVLVVDDVVLNREVVRDMLESTGVRIRFAGDGQEAVDAVMLRRPDCVLMDCQMPVMDGYEATRIIRGLDNCRDLPIIAFTANALVSEQERCRDAGMDGYVSKPVRRQELLSALIRYLFKLPDGTVDVAAASGIDLLAGWSDECLPEIPGVDQQVGLHYIGGNVQHYRRLLHTFTDTSGKVFATDFNAALNEGDWENATRLAHSMKSSARLIGAANLGELVSKLEVACHSRQGEIVESHLKLVLDELDRVVGGVARAVQE